MLQHVDFYYNIFTKNWEITVRHKPDAVLPIIDYLSW